MTQVGRRCTGADHPAASQRALPKASPARLRTATVPGSTESRPTRSCPGRDAARPYRIVPRRSAALAPTRFGERTRPRVPPTAPRRRHGSTEHPHRLGRRASGGRAPLRRRRTRPRRSAALPKASLTRPQTATVLGSTESRPTGGCPGRDAARPYRIVLRRSAALAPARFGERTRPRVPPTAPRRRHGSAVQPHRLGRRASGGRARCVGAVQAAAPQRGPTEADGIRHPASGIRYPASGPLASIFPLPRSSKKIH